MTDTMVGTQAVILAGGLGTRLRPFTQIIPKPLLPVGDRSVLEIQIDQLKKHGVKEIIFATNYRSNLLESYFGDGSRFGVEITYSLEEKKLGTCGPLSLLRDKLTSPFIVMNGDILTNLDFDRAIEFHLSKGGLLSIVSKDVVFPLSYGNLIGEGECVTGIQEKPDIHVEISTGIYVMSHGIFDFIPYNEKFGMDELVKVLLARQMPIYKYKTEQYWLDIGRMEDYEKAQEDFEKHFK